MEVIEFDSSCLPCPHESCSQSSQNYKSLSQHYSRTHGNWEEKLELEALQLLQTRCMSESIRDVKKLCQELVTEECKKYRIFFIDQQLDVSVKTSSFAAKLGGKCLLQSGLLKSRNHPVKVTVADDNQIVYEFMVWKERREYNNGEMPDGTFSIPVAVLHCLHSQKPLSSVESQETEEPMACAPPEPQVHPQNNSILIAILKQVFGYETFRPLQQEVIEAILKRQTTVCSFPTGGGKSMTYLLPSLLSVGTTLVISPTRVLILDQLQHCQKFGIPACDLFSDTSPDQEAYFMYNLRQTPSTMKLVYITPEKLLQESLKKLFSGMVERGMLARVVVEEAHCICEWGDDFRPEFKEMGPLIASWKVQVLVVSATLPRDMQENILSILHIKDVKCFKTSSYRSNLNIEVKQKKDRYVEDIISFVKSKYANDSGIVYCQTKLECMKVSQKLIFAGIVARPYHAGLQDNDRRPIQCMWANGAVKVVCATDAFGMGIDKPDVRYVLHTSFPLTMVRYVQQLGRAGRDSIESHCIAFYRYSDKMGNLKMCHDNVAKKQKLLAVINYMENFTDCRHKLIGDLFGEEVLHCGSKCDTCKNGVPHSKVDATEDARNICACLMEIGERKIGVKLLALIMRGSTSSQVTSQGFNSLQSYSKCKKTFPNNDRLEKFIISLINKDVLAEVIEQDKLRITLGAKANRLMALDLMVEKNVLE